MTSGYVYDATSRSGREVSGALATVTVTQVFESKCDQARIIFISRKNYLHVTYQVIFVLNMPEPAEVNLPRDSLQAYVK